MSNVRILKQCKTKQDAFHGVVSPLIFLSRSHCQVLGPSFLEVEILRKHVCTLGNTLGFKERGYLCVLPLQLSWLSSLLCLFLGEGQTMVSAGRCSITWTVGIGWASWMGYPSIGLSNQEGGNFRFVYQCNSQVSLTWNKGGNTEMFPCRCLSTCIMAKDSSVYNMLFS